MATFTPSPTIGDLKPGQAGGGTPPSVPSGGGDSGRGGGPNYVDRLRRARVGMTVALAPIAMLFVAFTSAYVVRKGLPTLDEATGKYVRDWLQVNLPFQLLLVNTFLLVLSSITMELARRQVTRQVALAPVSSIPGVSIGKERSYPWLGATVVLGMGFLAGQWMAWRELADRGFYLATSPSSSFVYLLTGAHAVHLAGGIVALIYASATALTRKSLESRRIVIDVTAWYWHFMAVLWIYIFALLELAR